MKRYLNKLNQLPKKVKILLGITSLFIGYILLAKIEISSPGEGVISGVSNRLEIVSPASGFINQFAIKTGDKVEKEQILFSYTNLDVFHQEKTLTNLVTFANERINELEENKKLLNKILDGSIKTESEYFFFAKGLQSKTLSAYRELYGHILLRMEISNLRDKYISQIKESSELEKQINILKKKDLLLKNARAPEIEKLNNNAELSRTNALMTSGELNAQGLLREISLLEKKYTARLIGEIQENETLLHRLKKEKLENSGQMDLLRNKIRANSVLSPANGVVLSIEKDLEKGSYVEASNLVMVIKKQQDTRVIEGKILAKYRPFIAPKLSAKIVVNSPGFKKIISGKVTKISADSFTDRERTNQERYYSVQITPEQNTELLPEHDGLPVMLYISSKEISVFHYLTALVSDNMTFNVW
ncbi:MULTISPECIES: HlyD family efflux transporter periplasmic adaptor subunit [Providencia]|uniref:HlyD family efflux transporter periplasmic adaptor subunit n=1 Tax=Providencia TaxID=586 RepID=UPI001B98DFFC|nr:MULTISPECIES: HlyD family efflux transporter periplasmic adaptor subunit [Providencia]MCG5280202.1 HlyD family efflux transporter periplasmic adaptor subunit [Providencia rettgeri]MCX9110739.1 HlyD family efflux transporter periplasmic adaptor subunit [Providencia rettgeri]MCX9118625.1 HlyD family efflux transporter periplasmic adaptor subunit [Providencia rettgeri]MDH2367892.1 HlyD family efflux transporter periplasmic adaptor subunit [Providencia rettgeri]HBC7431574.1 HlyD family efflux t